MLTVIEAWLDQGSSEHSAPLSVSTVTRVSPCYVDTETMHSKDGNGWCEGVLLATEKYRKDCQRTQQYDKNSTQHRAKLCIIHDSVFWFRNSRVLLDIPYSIINDFISTIGIHIIIPQVADNK